MQTEFLITIDEFLIALYAFLIALDAFLITLYVFLIALDAFFILKDTKIQAENRVKNALRFRPVE